MKLFLALPKTILKAIEASSMHEYAPGKFKSNKRTRRILEDVLATGKPNLELIEAHQKGLFE